MVKKELQIDVFQSSREHFDIENDVLTLDKEKYILKKTSAILNLIEIKDRKFFQVGLGYAMHREMENFARNIKCDEIRLALYHPFGEFQNGTRDFYEKVGYIFERTTGVPIVYKPLTKENDFKMNVNTSGTPIKEKYLKLK